MLFPIASSRSARDPPPARPTGAQRSFLRASNVPAFSEGHYETVLGLFQYVVAVQVKHLFEYLLIEAIDECRQVLRSPGEVAGRPHIPLLLELPEGTTLGVLVGRLLESLPYFLCCYPQRVALAHIRLPLILIAVKER